MLKNIEAERARLGLTKEKLSDALGISQNSYVAYVQGKRPIPSSTLVRMAQLFKVSTDYLLGLTDQ